MRKTTFGKTIFEWAGPLGLRTALTACLMAGAASAEGQHERDGGRRGPPPVALEACADAATGAACSFEGRQGDTFRGTCHAVRDGDVACVPEGHRRGGGGEGRHGGRDDGVPEDDELF